MNQKSLPLAGERSACPSFTDKQGQYLAFIWAYHLINGRAPAELDMQRFFGVTAPSVHHMVPSTTAVPIAYDVVHVR
ncbi:hypothetical protein [Ralstonia syzygii]|uniref:hypothetical protein n=1 Tax=Ralstonia syzygii TaxID=28097 RepID=UPI001E52657A|nr:hypothetical protein [Ralstonia syzygii]